MTTHLIRTRGYYATFIQFQLVCNCLQYTITHNIVRRPLNKVNLFFGNWNLFLIDSVGCFVIIVIRLCSTISGATECDTVQHFHWLSFECRDCFTHCSISIFYCNFNCFFPSPSCHMYFTTLLLLDDTRMLEYNWIWLYLFCWSVRFSSVGWSTGKETTSYCKNFMMTNPFNCVHYAYTHMRPFIGNNNWTMWKSACEKQKLRRSKEIDEERRKANSFPQIVALIQLADIIGNFYIFSGWKCVGTSIACIVLWSYNRQSINYKTV